MYSRHTSTTSKAMSVPSAWICAARTSFLVQYANAYTRHVPWPQFGAAWISPHLALHCPCKESAQHMVLHHADIRAISRHDDPSHVSHH